MLGRTGVLTRHRQSRAPASRPRTHPRVRTLAPVRRGGSGRERCRVLTLPGFAKAGIHLKARSAPAGGRGGPAFSSTPSSRPIARLLHPAMCSSIMRASRSLLASRRFAPRARPPRALRSAWCSWYRRADSSEPKRVFIGRCSSSVICSKSTMVRVRYLYRGSTSTPCHETTSPRAAASARRSTVPRRGGGLRAPPSRPRSPGSPASALHGVPQTPGSSSTAPPPAMSIHTSR